MIVITGAAGFIGSCMIRHLNESGRHDLVLVDDFPVTPVEICHGESLQDVKYLEKIPRDLFFDWLELNHPKVDFILHFGTETTAGLLDENLLREYNLEFSQRLWSFAAMNRIPLLYAASSVNADWHWSGKMQAGECSIQSTPSPKLSEHIPENSRIVCERMKRQFDQWVLKQRVTPPLWAGFAMPEVYGPYEAYLGASASSVFHLFRQWQKEGRMVIPLFENSESSDNEPKQDRIFVKDVVTVFIWFINHLPASGFYYLGTGYPRPMSAVAAAIFSALKLPPKVEYQLVSSSEFLPLQDKNPLPLNRVNRVGYKKNFTPLEKGVRLYVKNFLEKYLF